MSGFNAAVLGSPIAHSLSPVIHRIAYEHLGLSATYQAIEVKSGELANFLASAADDLNCFSLTMPLKEELVELGFATSELATRIRSGNTLVKRNNTWRVENTDVIGFQQAIAAHTNATFSKVLIIGTGATARSAVAALDGVGCVITVLARSSKREREIRACALFAELEFIDFSVSVDWAKYDLVINTTPSEVANQFANKISHASGLYFESLYNPWPTLMLKSWREAGLFALDGVDLLVHQAISQIAIFSGSPVKRSQLAPLMRAAALASLASL
jgi:shikimate dehydrogenase